ncbi:hypothetical protein QFZ94_003360 [Paraburkholderia sp. JPY465]|uniref:hypothetical protein n=1 Tax=Paraburkholderia sp. JPY465 TaxID=3042285 RepID=UPI003D20B153
MSATTPITWNDPTTARASLAGLLDAAGGITVLVRIDTNNPHAKSNGPKYRSARFAPAVTTEGDHWLDANTGLDLHTAVTGWAVPE